MKKLLSMCVCAVVVAGTGFAQGTQPSFDMTEMTKVPEEMKSCEYLVGKWDGEETHHMGGGPTKVKSVLTISKALGGKYLQQQYDYVEPAPMTPMKGLLMLSYDPILKSWRSYWFDSMSSAGIALRGKMAGDKMESISDPFEMDGNPETVTRMKSVWTKVSDREAKMQLFMAKAELKARDLNPSEMAPNKDQWELIMDATYKKRS